MPKERRKGVLLVEDDEELLKLFTFLLELENCSVFQAQDGVKGLETLGAHVDEIDLLITDLGLPHLGGVELISKARALKPGIKIIGTSGLGGQNVRDMVLQAGADRFIPKPFQPRDVINEINAMLK